MTKDKILLIGGGGHCKSCIDVIEQTGKYEIIGIIDLKEKVGLKVLNYNIIGTDNDIPDLIKICKNFLITLGQLRSPERRIKLFEEVRNAGGKFPIIISPFAYVSKHASISDGTIIMHQTIINAGSNIGTNCIINSKALIEHDAVVGNHCHIATGAIINGGVQVGESCFVGSGVVTKQNVVIPPNSFVKASTLVK